MSYYANPDERVRLIRGLHDIADFLDQNPDVPAPGWADLMVFPPAVTEGGPLSFSGCSACTLDSLFDHRLTS